MEKIKKIEQEKPPIVDVEINEATLKRWKDMELGNEILDLIDNFEKIVPPDGKFILSADKFPSTKSFVEAAEISFNRFNISKHEPGRARKIKNFDEKLNEVKNDVRKVILNFAFKEMEFNPGNPIIIREEEIHPVKSPKGGPPGETFNRVKYFATNRPGLILVSNGVDWWLERKGED